MELDAHIDFLRDFAHEHLSGHSENDQLIRLKLDHSLQVLDNARKIVDREGVNGDRRRQSLLAALYHDIGRFPQFARFKTFNDRESVNHARLGVLALRESTPDNGASQDDWRVVRAAVGLHNVKNASPRTPASVRTPVMVVRDADKLDILRIMVRRFTDPDSNPAITFGLDDDQTLYSPSIYETVMRSEVADYRDVRYVNDFKLLAVGWLQDFAFLSSLQLIGEQGFLADIFATLPDDENIQALRKKTDVFLRNKGISPP